jgi:hypothetical protein
MISLTTGLSNDVVAKCRSVYKIAYGKINGHDIKVIAFNCSNVIKR